MVSAIATGAQFSFFLLSNHAATLEYTDDYKLAFLYLILLVTRKNHDKQMEYIDLLGLVILTNHLII